MALRGGGIMTTCAVIKDGLVLNNIVAELDSHTEDGTYLVLIPDMYPVSSGWTWDGISFIQPNGIVFVLEVQIVSDKVIE